MLATHRPLTGPDGSPAGFARAPGRARTLRVKLGTWFAHRRRSPVTWPALAFVLGLCLSVIGAVRLDQRLSSEAQAELRRLTNRVAEEVSRRFREPIHGMEGARGLFSARSQVTPAEFRAYVESRNLMHEFPGVLGFGFIERVEDGDPAPHEAHGTGGAGQRFAGDAPQKTRANRYVLKYIEPEQRHGGPVPGVDLRSTQAWRAAIEQSVNSGEATLSAATPVAPLSEGRLGFMLFMPVFGPHARPVTAVQRDAQLVGLVYAPLDVGSLLGGIYEVEAGLLSFELIDDASREQPGVKVFDSASQLAREAGVVRSAPHASRHDLARPILLPGREFTLHAHSTPKFEASHSSPLPWVLWIVGTLSSAMLAALLWQRATARRRAQTLANIIDATQVGTWEWNVRTGVMRVDELWARQLGYSPAETGSITRDVLHAITHPDDQSAASEVLERHLKGDLPYYEVEVRMRHQDGRWVWILDRGRVFERGIDGMPLSMHGACMDVTLRRNAEQEAQHRSFHDRLTGLPNRERFYETLKRAIADAGSGLGRPFAVMFLDFDRFKLINDSHGHGVGDEFLVQASARLAGCLRSGDMLARMGGDEFGILAVGLNGDSDAVELAQRLLNSLRKPLQLSTLNITASASIGITFSSIGYTHPADMLRDADIAMYRAKGEGKDCYALFNVQLHADLADRVWLEAELRQALPRQALSVVYQPLVDLQTGRVKGFEALSRWTHAEHGPVSPAAFIAIAEESGLINQLTDGVVRQACAQLRAWQREFPALDDLQVHVNVSARDVTDPEFVSRIRQTLRSCDLAPHCLVIELTENILMAQLTSALGNLNALRDLGVSLSVDDFGTGYTSLSHLSTLPIDSLKIDMSFVKQLRAGSSEMAVVRAVVLMGRSLNKEVIAEGIETRAQMDLLRELGCDSGQGYYLSRPVPAESLASMLKAADQERTAQPASTGEARVAPDTAPPTESSERVAASPLT